MTTDTYVEVQSLDTSQAVLEQAVDSSFELFRDFAKRYSRFSFGNELYQFNTAEGEFEVSAELYSLLEASLTYYKLTEGLFDPAILPALLEEGYTTSIVPGGPEVYQPTGKSADMLELKLLGGYRVSKPKGLLLDFGGIGKGFVADKVANYLAANYKNYVVDAGGDIYFAGSDIHNGYDSWFSQTLHPYDDSKGLVTLRMKDAAVATSGITRRHWKLGMEDKHHIIDPRTAKSVSNDVLTATVISESTIKSDVLAKTLVIMGASKAIAYCKRRNLAGFVVNRDLEILLSPEMEKYVQT
jgi:thiamine biosynthesis lipoprotein